MSFAENPNKVRNIVNAQQAQFRELYHRLVVGLPGVHWSGEKVEVSHAFLQLVAGCVWSWSGNWLGRHMFRVCWNMWRKTLCLFLHHNSK